MTKKKAKPKKKAAPKKPTKRLSPPRPKQGDLPGMEDRGIKELESKAEQLDDAQTQKKDYAALEKTLNEELVDLMVKHGKTEYHHKGVHIVIPPQKQKVKVTIGELQEPDPPEEPEEETPELSEDAEVVHSND